ncbi:MAG: DNA translocase FtsK, partial [Patescibacteria group bacterium]
LFWFGLRKETRSSIVGITFFLFALILMLASLGNGGKLGDKIYIGAHFLFGIGYFVIPALFLLLSINFFRAGGHNIAAPALVAGPFFVLSALGLLSLFDRMNNVLGLGGSVGYYVMSPVLYLFAPLVTGIIFGAIFVVAILILSDTPLHLGVMFSLLNFWKKKEKEDHFVSPFNDEGDKAEEDTKEYSDEDESAEESTYEETEPTFAQPVYRKEKKPTNATPFRFNSILHSTYTTPPLSLLSGDKGRPGYGDIKANANIIKRTFQNFGIHVEMDEVSVGPSITRYALKPAEGVRLVKITTLQHDLELALAAAPIRIEAPIPGKSLVGIEIPNSVKSTVGLGTLLSEAAWTTNPNPLFVPLGKGISGAVQFMNIAKMPHVLVAGATGSGKSVSMHTMITSLLYRNSPEQLRFIMIDPKRVELTSYNGIPHLLTPVITEAKKAILTLKWATREMDRRYDVLQEEKCRDIDSYHKNILRPALEKYEKQNHNLAKRDWQTEGSEPLASEDVRLSSVEALVTEELPELMPYIIVIIDELADIMVAYPRELESAIVRLAQMSRATGIHLVLSTQRPSVNIITGLIKANIPARIALQVASQIDSRTILDMSGAENLLGAGDMLFLSAEMPKPIRLQSAFISESEVKSVVKFLKDHYEGTLGDELNISNTENRNVYFDAIPEEALVEGDENDNDGDNEKYGEAKALVISSGKASTSFLQRRLGLGYARAARMMDILEERGVVGPGSGAKPRDVLIRENNSGGFGRVEDV